MPRFTPPLGSKGKISLRAPWSTNPNVLYTCKAVRTFDDVYNSGRDVYHVFYKAMGLIEGSTTYTPTPFVFEDEVEANVVIVTLSGDDGGIIYVPDSFISTQPDVTEETYSHMVISASLSAISDKLDLSALKTQISNLIQGVIGLTPAIQESRLPSLNNPSPLQHALMEAARRGAITLTETDRARAERLQAELVLCQNQVATLTQILRNNNLLP